MSENLHEILKAVQDGTLSVAIHSLLIVSNRLSVSSFTFISFIVSVFLASTKI